MRLKYVDLFWDKNYSSHLVNGFKNNLCGIFMKNVYLEKV